MDEPTTASSERSDAPRAGGRLLAGLGVGLLVAALLTFVPLGVSRAELLVVIGAAALAAAAAAEMAARAPRPTPAEPETLEFLVVSPTAPPPPVEAPRVPAQAPFVVRDLPLGATASGVPSTSIPGAYLAALEPRAGASAEMMPADPPPIAAALPFAAMARPGGTGALDAGSGADDPSAMLEVELARLRASIRGLEGPASAFPSTSPRLSVSGAHRTIPPDLVVADAVVRGVGRHGGPAAPACPDCGTTLEVGAADAPCARCERGLCANCSERHAVEAGPRYCDECRAIVSGPGAGAIPIPATPSAGDPGSPEAGGWWDPDG